ncbi:MAG: sugar ABC transporter ATP-binding protein, partial [Treponema sp.]|nr:sugar ABC transporter ATP-binding protein [Treponema sp.]
VVGISGLMGAGRTELAMSIFGHSYGANIRGQIFLNGKEVHFPDVKSAIKHGLAYVTEDRKGNGLILSESIAKNTVSANLQKIVNKYHSIDIDLENKYSVEMAKDMHTKCASVQEDVGNLSGGNQQKVLIGKWLFAEPDILILDEPTRGIDVGAKYEIYCIINKMVSEGKSVLMISSEMPEILGMCDRIYIMNEGKFVGEMKGSEATQEKIMTRIIESGK